MSNFPFSECNNEAVAIKIGTNFPIYPFTIVGSVPVHIFLMLIDISIYGFIVVNVSIVIFLIPTADWPVREIVVHGVLTLG
jgi:hypothetical protein